MDYEKLAQEISVWMYSRLELAGSKGFVVGLSGGIDSAVTAGLCKRAVGDEVLGVWMPCHSVPEDETYARMTAEVLGIDLLTVDLGPVYDAFVAALPEGSDMANANLKPRLRMSTVYYLAQSRNDLVAGTGQSSEVGASEIFLTHRRPAPAVNFRHLHTAVDLDSIA